MKLPLVLAALALLAGCGENDETAAPASPPAQLADVVVTVDDGTGESKAAAHVTCAAAGDSKVCQAIADMDPKTFEPVPGNVACTQQYGGPETATVKGTIDGRDVDAKFSRVNGCEIARWDAVKPLLEAAE